MFGGRIQDGFVLSLNAKPREKRSILWPRIYLERMKIG